MITYILRGNSWSSYLQHVHHTYYIRDVPLRRIDDVGFRIIKLTKIF